MSSIKINLNKKTKHTCVIQFTENCCNLIAEDYKNQKNKMKFALICDKNVAKFAGEKLSKGLKKKGLKVELITFKPGEKAKSWENVIKISEEMMKKGLTRNDTVIALGGGVTGDLAGFIASIFMRGIPFIQIPTSLLCMTDAAIGGKTGINLQAGKNLLGSFHQPEKIYIDISFLKTLPKKQIENGYAEIIKHAVISNKKLFKIMEKADKEDLLSDLQLMNKILIQSCKVKADIVQKDEKESRLRMKLNLGHTIGHAVEKCANYSIDHGKAVSIGLSKICDISVNRGTLSQKHAQRIKNLLTKLDLPLEIPKKLNKNKIYEAMLKDKKVQNKKINFVVPTKIGKVEIKNDITKKELLKVL